MVYTGIVQSHSVPTYHASVSQLTSLQVAYLHVIVYVALRGNTNVSIAHTWKHMNSIYQHKLAHRWSRQWLVNAVTNQSPVTR